jgi:hypothetical protein
MTLMFRITVALLCAALFIQVVDASGIDLVIAAIKNHTTDPDVLNEGCKFLSKLVALDLVDHRRRIIDANGLEAMCQVFRDHQGSQEYLEAVKYASKAVRCLVPEPEE